MRNGKFWGVLGLLLALVVLLTSNAVQEATSAEQPEVEVTLEITNTADPGLLGAPIYEISTITFTKNFAPIATQFIFPPAAIAPGETRIFGPYTLAEEPNDLTIRGRKTFPFPPVRGALLLHHLPPRLRCPLSGGLPRGGL